MCDSTVSAKNISFDKKPLISGTPAMAALATIAAVAVIGMNLNRPERLPQVARAGFVIDDPCRHEQRGFEGGMIEDVKDRGDSRKRAAKPEQQRDQPQVADRRIGEKPFEILLEDCRIGAENQRDQARQCPRPRTRCRCPT